MKKKERKSGGKDEWEGKKREGERGREDVEEGREERGKEGKGMRRKKTFPLPPPWALQATGNTRKTNE